MSITGANCTFILTFDLFTLLFLSSFTFGSFLLCFPFLLPASLFSSLSPYLGSNFFSSSIHSPFLPLYLFLPLLSIILLPSYLLFPFPRALCPFVSSYAHFSLSLTFFLTLTLFSLFSQLIFSLSSSLSFFISLSLPSFHHLSFPFS